MLAAGAWGACGRGLGSPGLAWLSPTTSGSSLRLRRRLPAGGTINRGRGWQRGHQEAVRLHRRTRWRRCRAGSSPARADRLLSVLRGGPVRTIPGTAA